VETFAAEKQPEIALERIEQKIRALDWRDIELWCIGFVVLVVLGAGFVVLVTPQILTRVNRPIANRRANGSDARP
jgi:hypothetical protein